MATGLNIDIVAVRKDAARLRHDKVAVDQQLVTTLSNTLLLFPDQDAELRKAAIREDYIITKAAEATEAYAAMIREGRPVDQAWEYAAGMATSDCRIWEAAETNIDPETGAYR